MVVYTPIRTCYPNVISEALLAAQTSSVSPVRTRMLPPGRGRGDSLVSCVRRVSNGIPPRSSGAKGTSRLRRVNEEQIGSRRGFPSTNGTGSWGAEFSVCPRKVATWRSEISELGRIL